VQRAVASQYKTQLLNPMVEVKVDTETSESKDEEFFKSFDVICATCCTLEELLRLDDICHRNNIVFYAGDVFGYYGYMFANLQEHEYAELVILMFMLYIKDYID
jgi:ubiquitin-like 1-activating enzyme E1 A